MISPIGSNAGVYQTGETQSAQSQSRPATAPQSDAPQDTVHLSKAALAASGDVDHDGDSH